MAALTAASLAISLWNVDAGSRSEYYAAVARSMSMSWRNLVFGAMDPAGVLSVDKIPGSFVWMALSVRMLGMSTFAVLLPTPSQRR